MRKEIIRENVTNLPFSLHDARVTKIYTDEETVVMEFKEGYYSLEDEEVVRMPNSSLEFHSVDFDFTFVYVLDFWGNEGPFTGEKLSLGDFIEKYKELDYEIVDETYGYNMSKFEGFLYIGEDIKECNIDIYHLKDMKYVIEE